MKFDIDSDTNSRMSAGKTTLLLPVGYLVPLIAFGDEISGLVVWIVESLVEGMLALLGTIFVGITRYILAFPQPGSIKPLVEYYNDMIPLFIVILVLGAGLFLIYMQIFPESPKANAYRLGERALTGSLLVILGTLIFDKAVLVTNTIMGQLMPGSYSLDVLSGGIGALLGYGAAGDAAGGAIELGVTVFGAIIFAIFAGLSTLVTIFLFWVVLAMRMLIVYVVFGLFPLLVAMWVFDMGILKYGNQAANLAFKVAGFLLIIGILISGIMGVSDKIAGEGITESGVFENVSDDIQNSTQGSGQNNSSAHLAPPEAAGIDAVAPSQSANRRGGAFQDGGGSENNSSTAGNNSTNANLSGINESAQKVAESSGSSAGILIRVFTYIGGLWLSVALTMSGLGVVISTGSAGRSMGGGRSSQQSSQGSGASVTSDDNGSTVVEGESGQKGVVHSDGDTETSGSSQAVSDGRVTGDELEDVSTDDMGDAEPMSLRDKGKAAFGGASSAVASGAGKVADKAPDKAKETYESGSDAVESGVDSAKDAAETVKESKAGQAASWGYEKTAPYAKAAGRTAKGAAKTYGKMFAEEDPVRSAQIGMNAMRRSPVGDPRRSNATGDLKDSAMSEEEEQEEGQNPEMGPYQDKEEYQERGYEYGNDAEESQEDSEPVEGGSMPADGQDDSAGQMGPYQNEEEYGARPSESATDNGASVDSASEMGPHQNEEKYNSDAADEGSNIGSGSVDSASVDSASEMGPHQNEEKYNSDATDEGAGADSTSSMGPYQSESAYQDQGQQYGSGDGSVSGGESASSSANSTSGSQSMPTDSTGDASGNETWGGTDDSSGETGTSGDGGSSSGGEGGGSDGDGGGGES